MNITEQKKIGELPLWAKQLINRLGYKIQRQNEELSTLRGIPTKISYGNEYLNEVVHYIPEGIAINFKVGPSNRDEMRVHLDMTTYKKPCLYVSGLYCGIQVLPVASDVVRIGIAED